MQNEKSKKGLLGIRLFPIMVAAWAFVVYCLVVDQIGWPFYIALAIIAVERVVVQAGIVLMALAVRAVQKQMVESIRKQMEAAGVEEDKNDNS